MRKGSGVESRVSTVWQLKSSGVKKTNIFLSLLTVLRKYLTLVCLSLLICKMSITIPTPHMFFLRIKWDDVIETIRTESYTVRSYVNSSLATGHKWEGKTFSPSFLGTSGRCLFTSYCIILSYHLASLCSPCAQGVQPFSVDSCSDLSPMVYHTPK